jgi:hypothetical protein
LKYGLIPEFVGRLPVLATLERSGEDSRRLWVAHVFALPVDRTASAGFIQTRHPPPQSGSFCDAGCPLDGLHVGIQK